MISKVLCNELAQCYRKIDLSVRDTKSSKFLVPSYQYFLSALAKWYQYFKSTEVLFYMSIITSSSHFRIISVISTSSTGVNPSHFSETVKLYFKKWDLKYIAHEIWWGRSFSWKFDQRFVISLIITEEENNSWVQLYLCVGGLN